MASIARRIVLTGAESTGKSTLAGALAAHYRILWVPEFAREYAARMGLLSADDVEPIARGQLDLEDQHREAAGPGGSLILDTDLLSTWIYGHYYYGSAPGWIDERLRATPADLYLLCDTDLPWVADPVRDRAERRAEIQEVFVQELISRQLPFERIRGRGPERFVAAIRAVDAHLVR